MADRRKRGGRSSEDARRSGYGEKPRYVRRANAPNRRFLRPNRVKLMIIFSILIVAMAGLITRLIYINATKGDDYTRLVLSQMNYDGQQIPFKRGDIVDRNGTILATSERVYNLVIDAYVLNNSKVEETGDCLEPTLAALRDCFSATGINIDEIRTYITENPDNRYYVPIKHLSYEALQPYYDLVAIDEDGNYVNEEAAYVKGVWFEEEYVRKYPYGELAADVLGFTYSGNVGAYGVEAYYNDELNGTDGREYGYLNDGILERSVAAPVNGDTVALTLDINIQQILHRHLAEFNEVYDSLNSAVIVQDINSGEILGMESYPFFDPNDPYDVDEYVSEERWNEMTEDEKMKLRQAIWRNFCVSDTYEPGSTMKTMVVASALDNHVVTPENTFNCDGGMNFQDGSVVQRVACINTKGHGLLTLSQALSYSCNDALMQIGLAMGQEMMVKTWETFGVGLKTNIDLPGESSGIIRNAGMYDIDLAICSFGQSYTLTMVQAASTVASIVNGGSYYRPHVAREIRSENGSIIQSFGKELVRTTVSSQTSEFIRGAMEQTVEDPMAGGAKAHIDHYHIGGKTGTAEKLPRNQGNYLVSFVSAAPIDDPQYMIYVVLDEPGVAKELTSSILAVVMGRRIWEDLLPYLQIFPDGSEESDSGDALTETDAYGNPVSPETDIYGNPVSPETDAYGNPVSPETDIYGNPVSPETDIYGNPVSPETDIYGNPVSPETDANGNPADSETQSVQTDENGETIGGEADNFENTKETLLSEEEVLALLHDYGAGVIDKREYNRE